MSATTTRTAITEAKQQLESAGSDSPHLDAQLLLARALGISREGLYSRFGEPLRQEDSDNFGALVRRRCSGEPVAYILGYQEFHGRRFHVTPDVLVPRPDTELLVETALELVDSNHASTLHDLCTGSGCVAISIAAQRPSLAVSMSDVMEKALNVAKENSLKILGHELPAFRSDALDGVPGRFNIITCNPPYLSESEMARIHRSTGTQAAPDASPAWEPAEALNGGSDGLDLIRRIIRDALASLGTNGYIVFEVADQQADIVGDLLSDAGYTETFIRTDLAGRKRVIGGRAWTK